MKRNKSARKARRFTAAQDMRVEGHGDVLGRVMRKLVKPRPRVKKPRRP